MSLRRRVMFVLAADSSRKTRREGFGLGGGVSRGASFWRHRGGLARWRGASFFICQPHADEGVVDGNKCAVQAEGRAHFLQGGVGAGLHQLAQFVAAIFVDEGLAPAAVALGGDVSDAAALAKEFFHHAEGHVEAVDGIRKVHF